MAMSALVLAWTVFRDDSLLDVVVSQDLLPPSRMKNP